MENKEEFYNKCSEILGIEHTYSNPVPRRTRWNNRNLGNGRFSGFGLIRIFGNYIIVTTKKGTKPFNNYPDVYKYLEEFNVIN